MINSKANSSHNHREPTTLGIATATYTTAKPKTPPTKKRHHHHHHRHHRNRPRSKSLDLHGVHKKKHPHQYMHVPRYVGRTSPSFPKLKGNLWIRPAATTTIRDREPLLFPAVAGVSTSPSPTEQQWVDRQGFADLSPLGVAAPARHVSNDSLHPTWRDDATVLCTSTDSFFDSYLRPGRGPARIIFGESGKPIKSRTCNPP